MTTSPRQQNHSPAYTSAEEVKLSISVLFRFLRKDLQDGRLVSDLRGWVDATAAVLLAFATLYDHLFGPAQPPPAVPGRGGHVGRRLQPGRNPPNSGNKKTTNIDRLADFNISWFTSSRPSRAPTPTRRRSTTSLPVTVLATILLPVKDRREYLQEFRIH